MCSLCRLIIFCTVFAVPLHAFKAESSPGIASQDPCIKGTVVDSKGPVANARVRIQGTEIKTTTDERGAFQLAWPKEKSAGIITAWAPGSFVGWTNVTPGGESFTIRLKPYYTSDNIDYPWFSDEGASGSLSCSHCMPSYVEWQRDAHSRSVTNTRFLTMYNGTDLTGRQSPPTRFGSDPTRGSFRLPPDREKPYFGPGFKLDYPNSAGVCAACHAPVAAARRGGLEGVDINNLDTLTMEGVSCEFCHKIGEVKLNPATRLPDPDKPGVLSVRLFRPSGDQQLFFGPFDDVNRRVSYLPVQEESAFCAPCHVGTFSNVTIYNSYGEWLNSPYSDQKTGKTCQNCHMLPAGYAHFVYPEKGGIGRDPSRILSHHMTGASNEDLLRNAVSLQATGKIEKGRLQASIAITNDKTGHHVPTDSPLRQMILLVSAQDLAGKPLPLIEGPTVPSWGGIGDPENGYYAGLPGKAYAKILQEIDTQIAPTGAYWNPTRVLSDNRLAAFATDTSEYAFSADPEKGARLVVKLLFRRAFKELAVLKQWPDVDIVMAEKELIIKPTKSVGGATVINGAL